jgi:uncharacterized protein (TIRG00374 family)
MTIRGLQGWEIAVILLVNLIMYILVTLRWWTIVRAEARHIPFLPLLGVRVGVFGISYFTLGPQVGGEPLQVLSLERRYGVPFTRATASVILDKLLEFLADFLVLGVGVTAVVHAGLLAESRFQLLVSLVLVIALVSIPCLHLLLLYHKRYPITALLHRLPFVRRSARWVRFLRASEWMAGRFCQRHPQALLGALGVSLAQGAWMIVDYALMVRFLGILLPLWKTIAGWTAGWLSFLMPLPGGLGALEASQVFALGRFGISAGAALGVALLMRGRDLLIAGTGLILAGRGWKRRPGRTMTLPEETP